MVTHIVGLTEMSLQALFMVITGGDHVVRIEKCRCMVQVTSEGERAIREQI